MAGYIDAKQVSFAYNTGANTPVLALSGINLTVTRGEFVVIAGMNGSGKSTLARHFNALLVPAEGTVAVDGLDTRRPENIWPVRDRVTMVFQNPDNQIVAAVVEEDVAFGPENQGVAPAEIRQRVTEALEAVGMAEFAAREPHRLSGGQKQRVAVAGALALRPVCLVLDEATAMLDPRGRRELLAVIRRLNRETGLTVVLITHHMEEAALADRVVVLHEGRVVLDGAPGSVFTHPRLKELRLAPPPAVTLAAALREAGLPLPPVLTLEELAAALQRLRETEGGQH